MAVFNGAEYLRPAIDSVLGQTFGDFELIVVNDGSNDDTSAILESYSDTRMVIMHNDSNMGLTRSLNKGLLAARGEYVARQDADDISQPERFAKQVALLDVTPRVAIVGSQMAYLIEAGRGDSSLLNWKAHCIEAIRFQALFENPFVHSSVMFRTSVVRDEMCGYSNDFRTNQDFELWSRLISANEALNLPHRLVMLRARANSVSAGYNETTAKIVATVFARNLSAVFGSSDEFRDWPKLWSNVAVDSNGPDVASSEILSLARKVFRTYGMRHRNRDVLDEIRQVYSINMLRLARYLLLRGRSHTAMAVIESLRTTPGIAMRETVLAAARLVQKGRRYPTASVLGM